METRTVAAVASDIITAHREAGKNPPYLRAYVEPMTYLQSVSDYYGADDGEYVIIYALYNLSHWRHPRAKALKDELKVMLHRHDPKRYKMPK
jgi:hypothetical protein